MIAYNAFQVVFSFYMFMEVREMKVYNIYIDWNLVKSRFGSNSIHYLGNKYW